jgi:hypothetical protein
MFRKAVGNFRKDDRMFRGAVGNFRKETILVRNAGGHIRPLDDGMGLVQPKSELFETYWRN